MDYSIWMEGYAATGDRGGVAEFMGTSNGVDFKDACKNLLIEKEWDMSYYDEDRNTYWGCNFYDNEMAARASFG